MSSPALTKLFTKNKIFRKIQVGFSAGYQYFYSHLYKEICKSQLKWYSEYISENNTKHNQVWFPEQSGTALHFPFFKKKSALTAIAVCR